MRIAHRQHHGWRSRPIFGALGLRPVHAQHSKAEGELLARTARGRRSLVEIGVAEGGSAAEIAEVMAPEGRLTLIDPYFRRVARNVSPASVIAHRAVRSRAAGTVEWREAFSHDVVEGWTAPLDFLFIDGDHSYEGVRRDWDDWTGFVEPDGVVVLHDAHPDAEWTRPDHGPVRLLAEIVDEAAWRLEAHADSLAVLRRASRDHADA